jgi:Kdo2-lipid IVA lauroyltransferase/acyltransferase
MKPLAVAVLRAWLRVMALLPLPWSRLLGRCLGTMVWILRLAPAEVTRINLGICFPQMAPAARDHLARASLEETGQLLVEEGPLFHWAEQRWSKLARRIEGEGLLRESLAAKRGVLVLVPHLGNWEYLSLFLGKYGVTALYDPPRIPQLEIPVRQARSRSGARLVPIGRAGLRRIYETLADGGLVALLPDQVPDPTAGVYADFFGRPALTMTLAWRLIRRMQPRVLIASAIRVDGGFDLQFRLADPELGAADPLIATAAMNREIEAAVKRAPAQYQWEYKRFKRAPAGQPDCYRRPRRR